MGQLANQVALITGGAGGIGSAIARLFAAEGAAVVVADRSADDAGRLAVEITAAGGRTHAVQLDVTDSASVRRVVGDTVQQFGALTCLVNAAAILRTGHIDEMDEKAWSDLLAVNVTGTFLCTKYAVPALKAAGGGSIINLSSVSAFIGSNDGFAYTVTKGAVLSFTFGIAQELAPFGIRVNALCPGWVDGGFTHQAMQTHPDPDQLRAQANSLHALGRMARPDEVAQAALFLASGAASFVTGTPLFVDGGYMIKR
jgi:NAD(P)-dependent dehydrogenase (short-subunit alcohol dehydrogenase family)